MKKTLVPTDFSSPAENASSADNKIMELASVFVEELLRNQLPEGHIFHNVNHTHLVVQSVEEICDFLNISEPEREVVLLAAWFHDCGHINACTKHEEESKKFAKSFLKAANYPDSKITKVLQCIEATKLPQHPVDILGQIICDADLYHLAASNYFDLLAKLREEWVQIRNEEYSDKEWFKLNLNFLQSHQYFTDFGKEVLEEKKQSVIKVLEMACKFYE